jgi:GTP-binding protein Era
MDTRAAIIALAGRPNTGKSTLVNALTGEKISIVSDKPQTTRRRVYGVVNRGGTQIALADTPGFHRARTRLGDYMTGVARASISGADAAALTVAPDAKIGTQENMLIDHMESAGTPAVLIINKIDTVRKDSLLEVMGAYAARYKFDAIVPVSAKYGDGLDELFEVLEKYAREGPYLFPEGMATDLSDREIVAELVREKLLYCLEREVPHGVAVEITGFAERGGIIDVDATIYCEKTSHKGIIIGKHGAALKKIGELARTDIERYMGARVFLRTWVRVKEGWRDSGQFIRALGYPEI